MRTLGVYLTTLLTALLFCLIAGCDKKINSTVNPSGLSLWLTNHQAGEETLQFAILSNKVAIKVSDSNVVCIFSEGAIFSIEYEPKTTRPKSIYLELPAFNGEIEQSVFDRNADGIPDFRRLANGEDQVFYEGRWVTATKIIGKEAIVDRNGKETVLRFDGIRWIE